MRFGLGIFGVALVLFVGVMATRGGSAEPSVDLAVQKQAVLDYRECDGGMTVDQATRSTLTASRAQSIGTIRYVSHDSRLAKYAIPYKAQNGADVSVDFNYEPTTGKVDSENIAGLAVLDLMRASCR